ncbi:MAG: serine/threonine-protein kinase [Eubacteriales bacterium]|nr:serine/threonine-protein kinase [Eubacteriales bacterium]
MSEIIGSTYRIIREIGSGGGGTVYLAEHVRVHNRVVLKADKRSLTTPPESLRREVDILKELKHEHIPKVYDYFPEKGQVYTVMEYIEGESLDKLLERGEKFTQPQIIQWAKQLLDALAYLHSSKHGESSVGYIHADIKPSNLIVAPNRELFLIDFNIALALGEDYVAAVGSAGYASPEHYGKDRFMDCGRENNADAAENGKNATEIFSGERAAIFIEGEDTVLSTVPDTVIDEDTVLEEEERGAEAGQGKRFLGLLDARSDIYSVGATLYHLFSGKRPAKDAREVIPLSETDYNPQIVRIIKKAMEPDPTLRYQTAEEMGNAFLHLRDTDPRALRYHRNCKIARIFCSVCLGLGILVSFIGLKRIQTLDNWLKLCGYSEKALQEGDSAKAVSYALQALPSEKAFVVPAEIPEARKALTDALGVYDLSDGYKPYKTVEMPSEPLALQVSPDGKTAACIYTNAVAVFETETGQVLDTFLAEESALDEVEYLNNDIIIYAGNQGITAYNIKSKEQLWTGNQATSLSISDDGKYVASVYKDNDFAELYDTSDGAVKARIRFGGKHQKITVNDSFANPNDNLFELNENGSLLAVSFSDGSLQIFNLKEPENNVEIFDDTSGYTHFEGGFYQNYFSFSASDASESVFVIIDTDTLEQTYGLKSESVFHVQSDEEGIFVNMDHLLVKIHPVTEEETPLVTTSENICSFARSKTHTMIATDDQIMFFDRNANLISQYDKEYGNNFIQIAGKMALAGSVDSPVIRILSYEDHSEEEIFSYDFSYEHDEARMSADGKTLMLFSYTGFRIYDLNGTLLSEVLVPNADEVYDQQYIRNEKGSYLEITYNDGLVRSYDGSNGRFIKSKRTEIPDLSLYEEFETENLRIESPLHGTPKVYDKASDKFITELESDAYLTYITEIGSYIVAQYITSDGRFYGYLMDQNCRNLAYLPNLCDVLPDRLLFDYPTGSIRASKIYELDELRKVAQSM